MNIASYILIAAIAAWAVFSAVYSHKHGGCGSCGACNFREKDVHSGECCGSCGSCPYHQDDIRGGSEKR